MRGLGRCQPARVVLGLYDQRTSVVKRIEQFIGIGGDDAEALKNQFVIVRVAPLPSVPDAAEGKELVVGERHRPGLADLLFLLVFCQRLPLVEEVGRDQAAAMLPGLAPRAARSEFVGARVDGTEAGPWRLRPIRILLANSGGASAKAIGRRNWSIPYSFQVLV